MNIRVRPLRSLPILLAFSGVAALPAADCRWISTTDGEWDTPTNWRNNVVPGTHDLAVSNLDKAFFAFPTAQPNITFAEDLYLGTITFDAGAEPPANYVVGTPDGPTIHLTYTGNSYSVTCDSGSHANVVRTIAAPLKLYSIYQFQNNSADPSSVLVLHDITGAVAGDVVQLKGGNTGKNCVVGCISDGSSYDPETDTTTPLTVGVTKLNPGTWWLSGANTFSRALVVSVGTIVAGDDVPATGPSPFGGVAGSNMVRLGYANPNSTSWAAPCRILAGTKADGTPVTISRRIDVQINNKIADWPQDTCLGGANTSGTSRFARACTISNYRPLFLICATGGTCAFDCTWALRDRTVTIGYPGYEGTVDIENGFTINNALMVSNGVLRVSAPVTALTAVVASSVVDGDPVSFGTLSGTNTLRTTSAETAVRIEPFALLSGGVDGKGTLTVNADLVCAAGARIAVPSVPNDAALTSVTGAADIDGAVLDWQPGPGGGKTIGTVNLLHAEGGITGTPVATGLPAFSTVVQTAKDLSVVISPTPTLIYVH